MAFSQNAAAAAVAGLLLGGITLAGQNQAPPSELRALLAEVRGLRADLGQATGASIRMQVLVARLSLQEQRIAGVGRQLSEVQNQLTVATRERIGLEEQIKRLAGSAEELRALGKDATVFAEPIEGLKRELAVKVQTEQQLQLQVADVQNGLALEQGRWTDFNTRLDELERSLPAGR